MVTENSYFKVFQKKPVTKEPLTLVSASASYLRNIIDGSTSHHRHDPGVSGYKENVNSLEGIKRANDAVFSKQREFQGCVGDKNIFSFSAPVVFYIYDFIYRLEKNERTKNESEKLDKAKVIVDNGYKENEKVSLLDLVKNKARSDLYVVNVDDELTQTIKNSFEKHGCKVSVSKLEQDLITLYVLLNKKISIRKLRKLIEKGKRFGIDFCLTKTGMTSILLNKLNQLFSP